MITSFRNLEISNKILDLNIKDKDLKQVKDIYAKYKNYSDKNNVSYTLKTNNYYLEVFFRKPIYDINNVVRFDKNVKNVSTCFKVENVRFTNLPDKKDIPNIAEASTLMKMWTYGNSTDIYKSVNLFKHSVILSKRKHTNILHNTSITDKTINTLNWLYDTDIDKSLFTATKVRDLERNTKDINWDCGYYVSVKDIKNNRRLAIIHKPKASYWSEVQYGIIDVPHTNPYFNYIDENTYTKVDSDGTIQFDSSVTTLPKEFDPLQNFVRRNTDKITVFTQDIIDKQIKRYNQKLAIQTNDNKKKKDVVKKINLKIDGIDNEPLKINGTIFSKNSIQYESQILTSDHVSTKDLLYSLYKFHNLEDINYDRAMLAFINELTYQLQCKYNEHVIGTLGDIKVDLYHKYGMNKANNPYSVYYVNDIRINKNEFAPVLERATCFEDINLYNKFLKQVSECSLEIHKYLDAGLDITIYNPIKSERISLKIEMLRKDKRQYLKIGKNERLIRNTPKILSLKNKTELNEVIDILLDDTVVENLSVDDIKELVIVAKKAYIDAIEKSKKLLERTVQSFNLTETVLTIQNRRKKGYIVPGKINQYFVNYENNAHTSNCGVYTYPGLNYICIIDKTPNQQVGVDKFVNRIYALANDQILARQINTLNTT